MVMEYPLTNKILHIFFIVILLRIKVRHFFQLAKMEQGVYDLLDTVASKCRYHMSLVPV